MCQAYESEAASISSSEDVACRNGFLKGLDGKQHANPYGPYDLYSRKAWEHGFSCATVNENGPRMLPWAVEKLIGLKKDGSVDYDLRRAVSESFEATGRIPGWLRKML